MIWIGSKPTSLVINKSSVLKWESNHYSLRRIYPSGYMEYWNELGRHRLFGPARIYPNGAQEWWRNGIHTRLNGPAKLLPYGIKKYIIDGITRV